MIYFVQAVDSGAIKIGYAADPWRRLNQIRACNASEIKLLAAIEGGKGEEAEFHRAFSHLCIRGEWFRGAEELVAVATRYGFMPKPKRTNPRNTIPKNWNWSKADILEAERRALNAGASVAQVCRAAGIDRSTWVYWKQGSVKPHPRNWRRVTEALASLEAA